MVANNRIIQVLPTQIPTVWEQIKFAATKADEVDTKNLQQYLTKLLHELLNGKAQCFIRIDDNRNLLALLITNLSCDKITGETFLYLKCIYSFQLANDETWARDMRFVVRFAKKEGCSYISFDSRHQRIYEINEKLGFKETSRSYRIGIGGV